MHSHKILRIASTPTRLQDSLSKELKISKILAQLLINRGLASAGEAEKFLNVKLEHMLDPFSFRQMSKAVERIKEARHKKEKTLIFGDYDVDGITSVALLKDSLRRMGLATLHYMPHRIKEGYGLTKNILQTAKENKIKLLITVDCGIANPREIEELKKNNIDTIITDHHEPQAGTLPAALSIINPKVEGCGYKYRELAGVGVAYKLCQALSNSKLIDELDLVALGTVADVVPLTGENRVIVKEGLSRLAATKRPGLRALIEEAGIKNKKFNSTSISFILAPRLNASGRMDSAETSFNLLMSQDIQKARDLSRILGQHNRSRQKIESKILEEAEDIINKEVNFKEHKVIVVAKDDWHQGVLGIVAAKLADRFYRPAIVISLNEKMGKGSGRSIKNFHLSRALGECRQFLHTFGGHSHAVGLMITRESIDDFRKSINRLAHDQLSLEDLLPSLDIDIELDLASLTEGVVEELEKLEPFGTGNPEPLFYTRGLRLKGQPQSLGRQTLKFWVTDGKAAAQVIGFGMANLLDSLLEAKSLDIVYTPRMDNWQDDSSIILEARDIFFR
ncbi:MAG: single-stranded-DNA-specific exonuclease RecJ [Candidatus Omnitrophica bacterium]|jgi:single-stranded-DNA-specific exonuclease|nr:single-stranded-DNA-specific exonuclease RecJ [Candidatus Omnitrophota bacterium]